MKLNNMKNSGFTLLEIILVILLIGIASMIFGPNLFIKKIENKNRFNTFFNDLFLAASKLSKEKQSPIFIKFTKGNNQIKLWDNRTMYIPEGRLLNSAKINGKDVTGNSIFIFFYPRGYMDYSILYFSGDKIIYTSPLTLEAKSAYKGDLIE